MRREDAGHSVRPEENTSPWTPHPPSRTRRIADELDLTVVLATGDAADAALAGHLGDAAA
jgi:hypothetical protein